MCARAATEAGSTEFKSDFNDLQNAQAELISLNEELKDDPLKAADPRYQLLAAEVTARRIAVDVHLTRIRDRRAIVADAAEAVTVDVFLVRVRCGRAIVDVVVDSIAVVVKVASVTQGVTVTIVLG